MLAGSARRAVAVLNERLEGGAPFVFGALADLDHLVLEADASPDAIDTLRTACPALDIKFTGKTKA